MQSTVSPFPLKALLSYVSLRLSVTLWLTVSQLNVEVSTLAGIGYMALYDSILDWRRQCRSWVRKELIWNSDLCLRWEEPVEKQEIMHLWRRTHSILLLLHRSYTNQPVRPSRLHFCVDFDLPLCPCHHHLRIDCCSLLQAFPVGSPQVRNDQQSGRAGCLGESLRLIILGFEMDGFDKR